jgi:hypothetical protein
MGDVTESRAELLEYIQANLWPAGRHIYANPIIAVDGDTAHVDSDWVWFNPDLVPTRSGLTHQGGRDTAMTVSEALDSAMAAIELSDTEVYVQLQAIGFGHEECVMVDLAIVGFVCDDPFWGSYVGQLVRGGRDS